MPHLMRVKIFSRLARTRSLWWRPAIVFLVSVLVGLILWAIEERNHLLRIRLEITVTTEQAGSRLSDWVEDRMNLSRYLASKWEDEYAGNIPRYRSDASQFVEKFQGFQALNWIDADGIIRVVVPMSGNEPVLNVNLTENPLQEVRDAVSRARDEQRPTRTPAFIKLIQGGRGFATYWPIYDADGAHTGYINAVFRVNELVETCLERLKGANRYNIVVREKSGEVVYPIDMEPNSVPPGPGVSIDVVDQPWYISLSPSPAFYAAQPITTHFLVIPISIFVGLILAGLERVLALRKRDLQVSQEQYERLFNQAPIGYFTVRPDVTIEAANRVASVLTGCSRDTLSGSDMLALFPEHASARDRVRRQLELVRDGESIRVEETRMLRTDGTPFWVLLSVEGVYDGEGNLLLYLLTVRDISQRKEAEEARSCLSAAIEQAHEGVVITNSSGLIQYVNPAFHTIVGSGEKSVAQKPLVDILRQEGVTDEILVQIESTLDSGHRWQGTYSLANLAGQSVQLVGSLSPLHDTEGTLTNFVLILRDVTHEEELQVQLMQAQKLEAIGRFAGGIAHDFNNILQSLLGYASLARKNNTTGNEIDHCLREIERSGNRAAELVAQILAFGRKGDENRHSVQLIDLVEEVVELLHGALSERIGLEIIEEPTQYPILANPTQIHQILMNLATNGAQAIGSESEGTLTFRIGGENMVEPPAPGLPPGVYMSLSVEDSGEGMDEAVMGRVFEPYFTTRGLGRGSGLGLATVHGIVEQHGGTIRVESQVGKGTRFRIYFPAIADTLEKESRTAGIDNGVGKRGAEAGGHRAGEKPGRPLQILFVDDEEQIVESMGRLLTHFGFTVSGQVGSLAALAAFREAPDTFDVVITDLSMPEMNGIDLARSLNAIRPDTPVILCSGYGDIFNQEIADNGHVIKAFLKKPVTISALCDEIAALVES